MWCLQLRCMTRVTDVVVLLQVLKHEWPQNWPSFISDIVASSKVRSCGW